MATGEQQSTFEAVWNTVRDWPVPERRKLASRILASLGSDDAMPCTRQASDLIGAWRDGVPPARRFSDRLLMRALLDTNRVLDSLLARAPWRVDADEVLRRSKPGVVDLAVSALTVANLFYIGRKLVGAARARQDVRSCLNAFQILPIDQQTWPPPTGSLVPTSRTTSKLLRQQPPASITLLRATLRISAPVRFAS